MKLPIAKHEIGGVVVYMNFPQAERWNSTETSKSDLRNVVVHPADGRILSLQRATNEKLEPELSRYTLNQNANRVGDWIFETLGPV